MFTNTKYSPNVLPYRTLSIGLVSLINTYFNVSCTRELSDSISHV